MTLINALLLLTSSAAAAVPFLWKRPGSWLDPMVLFGGTVLVWGFGKYLFLSLMKPVDGLPPWAVASELQNGVIATTLFCFVSIIAYVAIRGLGNATVTSTVPSSIDTRIVYLVAFFLTAFSISAFIAILYSPNLAISWDAISAKRFLDSDLGPASRVGSIDYLLYKATLMARVPLYGVLVAVLVRRKASWMDAMLLTVNFLCIFVVAFIFSNRFNLLLGFVDMVAIAAVFVRKLLSARLIFVGILVFGAVILTSELRLGENRDRTMLEHIYEGRYFADVERTDKVIDYYQSNELVYGKTLYDWLYLFLPGTYGDGGEEFLNMGWEIGYHVFGLRLSGVPPGFIGELFMNFGWIGIAGGGLLFGAVSAAIAVRLHHRTLAIWFCVFLALVTVRIGLVLFNGNFGTAMIKIALEAGPAAMLVWFATRKQFARAGMSRFGQHRATSGS